MPSAPVVVRLESPIAGGYRCTRAADALDIDVRAKSVHELRIVGADLESPYHVGVIVGASGSGKTTLAQHMFGADCFATYLDLARPVIDQFPEAWSYDECAQALNGIGLTSVPCWIRPAYTLSNGQRARAEAALAMAHAVAGGAPFIVDEWTSVVDRTVARVMSHCLAKHARRVNARVIVLTCHYDVLEWLDPDWVIDCNAASYTERRSLPPDERARRERLVFDIRRVDRHTWSSFEKYHYLSRNLPGGHIETFGLFHGDNQVGFQCFANYVPHRKRAPTQRGTMRLLGPKAARKMHSNRTVIHPDYAGLGLGIRLIDATSAMMAGAGYHVYATFSSAPVYRAMSRNPAWASHGAEQFIGARIAGGSINREGQSFRTNVTMYKFRYVGPATSELCVAVADPLSSE